jgi:iron complex transport system ATP-binding protein
LLEAADLRFAYGSPPRRASGPATPPFALEGVTIRVPPRTVVGVLGPNGSGKTTLLRLLAGAIAPASGVVRLDGADLRALTRRQIARRLAVVPQETTLAFDYTALEIVLMGRYPHLGAFEVEGARDLAAARSALEATGTAAFADRPFRTLSGGEKQRVVIASALAQLDAAADAGPAVLLLDEPTASLDLHYQIEVASLITRLHQSRDISIVLSTHDLRLAASVATSIVLLARGRVLGAGPPDAMLAPPRIAEAFDVDEALVEHGRGWAPLARPARS